jgi:hypothetical protein
MLHKIRKSSGETGQRKVSPPGPTVMTDEQMGKAIAELQPRRFFNLDRAMLTPDT